MFRIVRRISKVSFISNIRWYTTLSSFRYLDLEHTPNGYSIIRMKRRPVNSFNLEFVRELTEAIDYTENLPECKGLVITSSLKVFSAGLDLFELHNMQNDEGGERRMRVFLSLIQELCMKIYQSPLVTIAAINGPAPAGGCALSLSCDYRVMVDSNDKIGLNETQVGLTVPLSMCRLYQSLIGCRAAEKHLILGTLFPPHEALQLGLVDAVVPADELISTVENMMHDSLTVPDIGRKKTKDMIRREYIDDSSSSSKEYMEWIVTALNDPSCRKYIGTYIKSLQDRKTNI